MYAYIFGVVAEKGRNELIIEAGGVGYQLICSMNTLQDAAAIGESMRVFTWLNVREDVFELFGFATREERALFLKLTGVTGVGPRTALGMLGSMPLRDLTLAIVTGDVTALSRAPGIGKKTAQRIALELKEKISGDDLRDLPQGAAAIASARPDDAQSEALLALQALGYTQGEAVRALSGVQGQSDRPDELVRLALRGMARSK